MNVRPANNWQLKIVAGVAVVFGVVTILSGGQALFGSAAMRQAVGDAVPFVLWFNFLSGFFYVFAGIGIARGRHWAARMALYLVFAIAAVFALFGLHILQGGAFQMRTVGAMTLRLIVWIIVASVAARRFSAAQ